MATLEDLYLSEDRSDWRKERNRKIYLLLKNHESEFNQTFDRPLVYFCDEIIGFDLLRFFHTYLDKNGASYDFQMRQQYGDRVADMIRELAKVV